ncbi:hypothetical protein [Candidatus Enterovibrio escicola]
MKEKIIKFPMKNTGIRDSYRVLYIRINAIIRVLETLHPAV